MSEYVPVKLDGDEISMVAASAVTGGQCVFVTTAGKISPTAGSNAAFLGIAAFDGATGDLVTVYCEGVQESTAAGAITAGDVLESAASGNVATHTVGTNDAKAIGVALTTAADTAKVRWRIR